MTGPAGVVLVTTLVVTAPGGLTWQYVVLFLAVAASWAGVPAIGATALGAAGVAASQGDLDLAVVITVATVAGEVGGLVGYAIGDRWGRQLLERPGSHREGREKMVERGERAYARWGRVAVFFTPAIVSGTAKMQHRQFALWNLIASFVFSVSVAASAFGIGRLINGDDSAFDIGALVVGLAAAGVLMLLYVRRRRRVRAPSGEETALSE
jgi:membrane protein DedA with SNARE-associated domain